MGQTMKTNSTVMKIAQTALFAALCYVIFTYLQIKIPMPGGDATSTLEMRSVCLPHFFWAAGTADLQERLEWESRM